MGLNFVTMNIYINAWLDCSHPFISVHNKFNDEQLVYFNEEEARQLIENGDVMVEDLQSNSPSILIEVITDLIALKSSNMIKQEVGHLSRSLRKRKPVFLISENDTLSSLKPDLVISEYFSKYTLKAV